VDDRRACDPCAASVGQRLLNDIGSVKMEMRQLGIEPQTRLPPQHEDQFVEALGRLRQGNIVRELARRSRGPGLSRHATVRRGTDDAQNGPFRIPALDLRDRGRQPPLPAGGQVDVLMREDHYRCRGRIDSGVVGFCHVARAAVEEALGRLVPEKRRGGEIPLQDTLVVDGGDQGQTEAQSCKRLNCAA